MIFEKIERVEAIQFLRERRPYRSRDVWLAGGKHFQPRNARGAGGAVDLICYGMRNENGKLTGVVRIGLAPYQNRPAVAAVGPDLAGYTLYLQRQAAIGVSHDDLVAFILWYTSQLRADILAGNDRRIAHGKAALDPRYLLSLDDPQALAIEGAGLGIIEAGSATGKCYIDAGALHAGHTKAQRRPTRWVDEKGEIRSVYQCGKSILPELVQSGARLISEGQKNRFLWVLGTPSSLEYAAWRRALPAWVQESRLGEEGLGWVQPRLLTRIYGCIAALNASACPV